MTTRGVLAVVFLLVLLGVAGADPDPWALSKAEGILLMVTITESPREYTIMLLEELPDDTAGPKRVEPPIAKHEVRVLDRCRRLIEEEEYEQAERILGSQVRKNKANYDAMALRALCRLRMGDPEKARASIRKSLIGNRRNPQAWKVLEELAEATGSKVERPTLTPRAWVLPPKDGDMEFGYANRKNDQDFPWLYYGAARAYYRREGQFEKDHPRLKEYRYTFRELLFAVAVTVSAGEKNDAGVGEELTRLIAEKKAGTLIPFSFFALYTEPIPKKPERDFDELLPVLEQYFDEHVLISPENGDGGE